ncbi:glycosyltransferase (plasmid) [Pontibacillus sp. ALD_SL1]|uniref:tetratricopeptide repeat-containing glycosyltransferase family 2 protein n=1 Tax=Pontibacillus sp. ALD_SL1 TaxID=2777185 RepID=UPI001A976CDA|nr:glycosyltransferase family 2 protein [Pontibacillus sp. ALD_SL1]QST02053.1 glycosyltransferase [Pontibacillus sp. ALD_SL1]
MSDKLLSCCMIVKNEDSTLERCLKSIAPYVDELIVVDTGSTDNTKAIAEQFTPHVYDFKWTHNFAEARNFALSKASGTWIVQIDADEFFKKEEAEKIRAAVEQCEKNVLSVRIVNVVGENKTSSAHSSARIFRNIPEHRYHFAIHEQILHNGDILDTSFSSITLHHTGYQTEVISSKGKHRRNLSILQRELKKTPLDIFMNYNISKEYLGMKDLKKALHHLRIAYDESKKHPKHLLMSSILFQMIGTLYADKQYQKGLKVASEAESLYPEHTDLTYYKGLFLEKLGSISKAANQYERCIQKGESPSYYQTRIGIGSILPLKQLFNLSVQSRDYGKVQEYAFAILEIEPHNISLYIPLIRFMNRSHTPVDSHTFLQSLQVEDSIKLKLAISVRLIDSMLRLYDTSNLSTEEQQILSFYKTLKSNNPKNGLSVLKTMTAPLSRHLTVIYYAVTKDERIFHQLSLAKTTLFCIEAFRSKPKAPAVVDEIVFSKALLELLMLGMYEEAETLLGLVDQTQPSLLKQIGRTFEDVYNDDLALQFYSKYLMQYPKDVDITLKVAHLLLASSNFQDAILFASSLPASNIRAQEIIASSYAALDKISPDSSIRNISNIE